MSFFIEGTKGGFLVKNINKLGEIVEVQFISDKDWNLDIEIRDIKERYWFLPYWLIRMFKK